MSINFFNLQISDLKPWFELQLKSGFQVVALIQERFTAMVKEQPTLCEKERMIQFSVTKKDEADKGLNEIGRKLFSKAMFNAEPIRSRLEETKSYQELSKQLDKDIQVKIQEFIQSLVSGSNNLHQDFKKHLINFKKSHLPNGIIHELGRKRFTWIHQHPLWNPVQPLVLPMAFETYCGSSELQVLGPTKSSLAPRNELSESAIISNFFHSTFSLKLKDDLVLLRLDWTRSGVPVELDQSKDSNNQLVKQILDTNMALWANQLTEEQLLIATDLKNPLSFRLTTVHLLQDASNVLAQENNVLAQEDYEAYSYWQSPTPFAYKLLDHSGNLIKKEGKEVEIFVKPDLLYFNVPCDRPSEASPTLNVTVEGLKALGKLVDDCKEKLTKKIEQNLKITPFQRQKFKTLLYDAEVKKERRIEATNKSLLTGEADAKEPAFKSWQESANALKNNFLEKIEKAKANKDHDFVELLFHFQKWQRMEDLFLDIKELLDLIIKYPKKDYTIENRFALAARLIYLSTLAEEGRVHFCCRNGKDRATFVDSEVKILALITFFYGRVPSYREQENLREQEELVARKYRAKVLCELGNSWEVPQIGSDPNIFGLAYKPFCIDLKAMQAFAEFLHSYSTTAHVAPVPEGKRLAHSLIIKKQ